LLDLLDSVSIQIFGGIFDRIQHLLPTALQMHYVERNEHATANAASEYATRIHTEINER
jgi:hypothetical protein